ncbi:glycosyltransferase family 2 protein [Pseudactinotalea sp. Z1732]|uniref:glycosyltransferase family 2 protein n=1 Tax=Micrococcales TaxID=85006 RepID=UPI003C7BF344
MVADAPDACAVVVGTTDSPYLPHTLRALATQTHPPERVLWAVLDDDEAAPDVLPADAEEVLAEAGFGPDRPAQVAPQGVQTVRAPAGAGFGEAVDAALDALTGGDHEGDAPAWLWLLHDDSAPDPAALDHLLAAVDAASSVGVAGVKQVDWDEPDRLVSVGVGQTVDGQRYTGIEDGEIDQGQHDGREDVYSVGTAGMLIRTRTWRRLGGPDPALGVFGDGADLSRRTRLAGQRVVVVPAARVRHARAGWHGLRTTSGARTREPHAPDPRRSFRARRTAQLHSWLVRAPLLTLPLVALAALVLAPLRALWRVASNELALAAEELRAAAVALVRPVAVMRARRRAARTREVSTRRLAPLQATWGQLWQARRNRRLQAAAEQRAARAPSELEMTERAAVARRRRLTFGALASVTTAVALVTLAPVVVAGPLIGGALLPVDVGFVDLWRAALGAWLTTGDGYAGPPDTFLAVLGVLSALTGGWAGASPGVSVALVLLLAMPLAATFAWFAAGAASRSVLVRAWAAGVWAFGPPLLLGLGQGRLGAVLAHLMLPLMALGIARALGVDRRDVVISGMVGAQRVSRRRSVTAGRSAREAKRARLAALAAVGQSERDDTFADLEPIRSNTAEQVEPTERAEAVESAAPAEGAGPQAGTDPGETGDAEPQGAPPAAEGESRVERATVVSRTSRAPSMAAAAAAGLAFAVAVAGAPVLLPAGLTALIVLALVLGRRRHLAAGRARLIVVALPAVVVLGPVWTYAIRTWADGGWRVLLADPGAPLAADPGPAWLTLLGWPALPHVDGDLGAVLGSQVLPLVATGALLVAALLALLRGGQRGRAVRIGWLISAIGLATALASSRTVVALGRSHEPGAGPDELVTGWAGPGTSLVLLGLLLATGVALDGLQGALAGRTFGWRQISAAVVTVLLVAGLVVSAASWTTTVVAERGQQTPEAGQTEQTRAVYLTGRGPDPVPALGRTLQAPEQGARVLALTATPEGIDAQLWRGNGPQLTETATVLGLGRALARTDSGGEGDGEPDQADAHLLSLVADLATGSVGAAGERLAQHAVAVVIVPIAGSVATGVPDADESARARLIARLDAVLGLERVTENPAGVIWRVSAGPGSTDTAIARGQVRDEEGTLVTNLDFAHDSGSARLSPEGTGRTVVLAERSSPAWRAEIDGRPLRAVADSSWRQAFLIPDDAAGELTVTYRPSLHTPWHVVTGVVLGLTVLLALPTRRRRPEEV